MIKVDVFGISFSVTFGFLFSLSLLSLAHSPSLGLMAVAACLVHELGHCFAMIILNVKICGIKFWTGGILIEKERRIIAAKHELLILLCGPLTNIVFAALYWLSGMTDAALLNVAIGVFNLIPCKTLDGGGMLSLFLEHFFNFNEYIQKRITVAIGIAAALALFSADASAATIATAIILTLNEAIS